MCTKYLHEIRWACNMCEQIHGICIFMAVNELGDVSE